MNYDETNTDRDLLDITDLLVRYRVSRKTIENWIKLSSFPQPHVRMSQKSRYWLKSEVMAWEHSQANSSTQAE